jgi:hypothetical protein
VLPGRFLSPIVFRPVAIPVCVAAIPSPPIDPAAAKGSPDEIARAFRNAFVVLDRRIGLFLSLPFATLQHLALQHEIEEIGRS